MLLAPGVRFGTVSDELVVHSSSLQRATTVLMRAIVGDFYYECYGATFRLAWTWI